MSVVNVWNKVVKHYRKYQSKKKFLKLKSILPKLIKVKAQPFRKTEKIGQVIDTELPRNRKDLIAKRNAKLKQSKNK